MTTLVLDRSGFQRFIRRIPPVYVFLILVFAGGAILDLILSDGQMIKNPAIQTNIFQRERMFPLSAKNTAT